MTLSYTTVASGDNIGGDTALFLAASDMDGVTFADLDGNEDDSLIAGGLLLTIDRVLQSINNPFGKSSTRSNLAGVSSNRINQTVTLTWQYYLDKVNQVGSVIQPQDGSGEDIPFTNFFPNASAEGSNSASPGDGIVIPFTNLNLYIASVSKAGLDGNLGNDHTDLLEALVRKVIQEASVRSSTITSGIVSASVGNGQSINTPNGFFNVTGFSSSDEPNLTFKSQPMSLTFQYGIKSDGTWSYVVANS